MSPLAFSFSSNNSTELGDFFKMLVFSGNYSSFQCFRNISEIYSNCVPNKFSYLANREHIHNTYIPTINDQWFRCRWEIISHASAQNTPQAKPTTAGPVAGNVPPLYVPHQLSHYIFSRHFIYCNITYNITLNLLDGSYPDIYVV